MARLRVELPEGYRFESCGVYFFLPFLLVSRSNLAPRGHYLPRKPRAQARGSVYRWLWLFWLWFVSLTF